MYKILWRKLVTTVSGGAILISFFAILSNVLGLIRDRTLAGYFGAGPILDSYYAAFKLPDLIFNTLVLGALASAFIPVFTRLWIEEKAKAFKLANVVLNYLLLTLVILAVIVFAIAPILVALIVPGFKGQQLDSTVVLTRIMLVSIVFFGASNVMGGILNSLKKFLTFSLAPVFYNLGIIFGITVFYPIFGLTGLAWGVVFGSGLHFFVQLFEALRSGWRYQWLWQLSDEVKRVFKLMIPRTIGLAANQLNILVITVIASTLVPGSLAVFTLANNLQTVPSSIFGIALAIAVFPVFSEALAKKDKAGFVSSFSLHFRRIIFLIIPISVFILLLRAQIVRVVLGSGHFDWQDTYYTAQTLGWFMVSLLAQSLIPMLARSFYALEDTKTPVLISFITIGINIAGSVYLGRIMGVEGLALAFSLASVLNMIILLLALRLRIGYLDDKQIILSTLKIVFNSIVSGVGVYFVLRIMANLVDMHTFVGIFTQGLVAGLVGIFIYFVLSILTNCQEIIIISFWLKKFFKPLVVKKSL